MCDPGGARTVGGVRASSRSVDGPVDDGPPSDPGADVDDVTEAARTRVDRRRPPARWGPLGTDRPTRSVRTSASPVASLAQELIAALHRLNRTILIRSATHAAQPPVPLQSASRDRAFSHKRAVYFRPAASFSAGLDRAKERRRREFRSWGRLNREPLSRLGAKELFLADMRGSRSQSFPIQVSASWVTEFHLAAVH